MAKKASPMPETKWPVPTSGYGGPTWEVYGPEGQVVGRTTDESVSNRSLPQYNQAHQQQNVMDYMDAMWGPNAYGTQFAQNPFMSGSGMAGMGLPMGMMGMGGMMPYGGAIPVGPAGSEYGRQSSYGLSPPPPAGYGWMTPPNQGWAGMGNYGGYLMGGMGGMGMPMTQNYMPMMQPQPQQMSAPTRAQASLAGTQDPGRPAAMGGMQSYSGPVGSGWSQGGRAFPGSQGIRGGSTGSPQLDMSASRGSSGPYPGAAYHVPGTPQSQQLYGQGARSRGPFGSNPNSSSNSQDNSWLQRNRTWGQ
jgi:hypothetical protein